jgi:hypothetical protein
MLYAEDRRQTKAILPPSGDQAGLFRVPGPMVSLAGSPPSGSIVKISVSRPDDRTNAILPLVASLGPAPGVPTPPSDRSQVAQPMPMTTASDATAIAVVLLSRLIVSSDAVGTRRRDIAIRVI